MKIFINIALFLLLTIGTAKAELVNTINIIGNNRISDETVKVYSGIQEDKKNYSKQDLDNILKNIYETSLKEYPVINQLVLIGEKSSRIKAEIKKFIQLKESNSFIKTYLDQDLNSIRNFLFINWI